MRLPRTRRSTFAQLAIAIIGGTASVALLITGIVASR